MAAEPRQCPTLYNAGFGAHRIEGIGDKHVPWIHNVKNTDVVTAIETTPTSAGDRPATPVRVDSITIEE